MRVRDRATNRLVSLGTFPTKADANVALVSAAADAQRGAFVPPDRGRVELRTYANEWLEHHPTLSTGTRDLYRFVLDKHVLPHLGDAHLGDIEPATVEQWFATLGRTTTTLQRAKAYRLLRTILNHAVKNSRVIRNPCMIDGGGKESSPERPVATIPQVFALAAQFRERLTAIVPVTAFGALRVGEAAGLQRADIDPLGNRIHIRRKVKRAHDRRLLVEDPKSDSKRTVTLPPQVMGLLEAHLDAWTDTAPDAWVFTRPHGTPVDHMYIGRLWRKARSAVADDDPTLRAKLHFHDLRGTGATLAASQGASLKEVMARLGHSTTVAALRYQHATADRDATIAHLLGQAIDQAAGATVTDLGAASQRSGKR